LSSPYNVLVFPFAASGASSHPQEGFDGWQNHLDNRRRHHPARGAGNRAATVVTAEDGNEVLKRLYSGFLPDLILLDMLIPRGGCDGWWFLQQRQLTQELAAVPVIILTALSVASEAWATSLGAAGLVSKPFESSSLLAEIRRFLAESVQV
jgi:CheY-like chemotaxis protein